MAVSIDGPPQEDSERGMPESEAADPRTASVAARILSLPFRATSITKRSTAAGIFWSSMFRTEKDGLSPHSTTSLPPLCGSYQPHRESLEIRQNAWMNSTRQV